MTPPTFETLGYDLADGIATITLNRPEKLNAFTAAMRDELIAAFDARRRRRRGARGDRHRRRSRLLRRGRPVGGRQDLRLRRAQRGARARPPRVGEVYRDGGGLVTLRIFQCLKPVIGAVNGAAVGIGVTMQLPMDIRLASDRARASASSSRAAASRPRPRRAGSCRGWWACRRALEWCYHRPRLRRARRRCERGLVRSRCTRRTNCCPPRARSPARSPTTPRRWRWR
ncbi:MAG: enoyl-CoA hydratase-related protein [Comamonadaceae bacterium]|nr:enoyl-CoA hydratase-related protein [Comamonadaceae bacterium]